MRAAGVDLSAAAWRRSTYSDAGADNCVEVADGFSGVLPVRDSKHPGGPSLVFPAGGWRDFVTGLRSGRL